MESMTGATSWRNPGKQPFLPPKSPFPSISASVYGDYGSSGSKEAPRREGHRQHHRTSSECFLIEEQPSWLDDLLKEPETSVRRGTHRRSSSDSFAYLAGARVYSNMDNVAQEEGRQRSVTSSSLWGSQEFDNFTNVRHYYAEANTFGTPNSRIWEPGLNIGNYSNHHAAAKEKAVHRWLSGTKNENEALASSAAVKQDQEESPKDSKRDSDKKDISQAKHSLMETDSKRVKQQFAQRSRVRKLQYISELERSVQALQAEGLEVSSELEFVDQQNLILNLENKALKQRLDSLAQEHLIKRLQQEMLEREIARLRLLFQQLQQPSLQPPPSRGGSRSRDINYHFAHFSRKHKEANSGPDPVTGLRI